MTDDINNAIQPTGEAKPNIPQGEGAEQQQFVSKDEFAKAMQDIEEKSRRQAQSYSMQAENRINKSIQEGLKNLNSSIELQKEMGIEIPEDKLASMRQKIITDAYSREDGEPDASLQPSGGTPSQTQPPSGEGQDPEQQRMRAEVVSQAKGMAEMAGFVIEPTDPEMADLMKYDNSPGDEFLKAYRTALNTKGERLRALGVAQQPNAVRGTTSSPDLMKEYQTKKAQLPRGNIKAHFELTNEYRKKGLQI